MDSLFAFAFIQALLKQLPPQLAERVEAVVAAHGFDTFLAGYLASPAALSPLLQSVSAAVRAVEVNPAAVRAVKRRISDGIQLGLIDAEAARAARTYGARLTLP